MFVEFEIIFFQSDGFPPFYGFTIFVEGRVERFTWFSIIVKTVELSVFHSIYEFSFEAYTVINMGLDTISVWLVVFPGAFISIPATGYKQPEAFFLTTLRDLTSVFSLLLFVG